MNWSLYESRSTRIRTCQRVSLCLHSPTSQLLQSMNLTKTPGDKLIALTRANALAYVWAIVEAILFGASTTGFCRPSKDGLRSILGQRYDMILLATDTFAETDGVRC